MLHVLRQLRRSFSLPGKVRTYVAYTAGEIVLIMIGILLALQLSEWNQVRKDKIEETEILNGLKREFTVYRQHLMSQKASILESCGARTSRATYLP
jgi:hypothetical protein